MPHARAGHGRYLPIALGSRSTELDPRLGVGLTGPAGAIGPTAELLPPRCATTAWSSARTLGSITLRISASSFSASAFSIDGPSCSNLRLTGAWMTFLALWTGALWGKPTWGAWWVWDARLTSELVLLFLYIGYMALHAAIDDDRRADRSAALLALVGVVNVPIIYFSVKWWNTLHQGASVSVTKAPSMATPMLLGMLVMALACWMYCIAVALARLRVIILERERHAAWANGLGQAA